MNKINDNLYFNSNAISAAFLANGNYVTILSDGGSVEMDADTFKTIEESLTDYQVNDKLYINPAHIMLMQLIAADCVVTLVNDVKLELSEIDFDKLTENSVVSKVNDNLYINPNYIVGTAFSNDQYLVTLNNGIQFSVSEEEYNTVSALEPVQTGSDNTVGVIDVTKISTLNNPNLGYYYGQVIKRDDVLRIDTTKLKCEDENSQAFKLDLDICSFTNQNYYMLSIIKNADGSVKVHWDYMDGSSNMVDTTYSVEDLTSNPVIEYVFGTDLIASDIDGFIEDRVNSQCYIKDMSEDLNETYVLGIEIINK